MLTNLLNPKVALTFGAFLPQFLPQFLPAGASGGWVFALGLVICGLAVAWFTLVGVGSGLLRRRVVGNAIVAGIVRHLTGGLLVAFGLRLAWATRR